jgi:hypothetical protein
LLHSIEEDLGLVDTFCVLGDDVVIANDQVESRYRDVLRELGCPVSEQKTISSNIIAEFAGKLIDSNGVLPVEKWKGLRKETYFDVVRQFGLPGLKLVPKRYRKVVERWASLPQPVGLGLNPKGISFNERIGDDIDLYLTAKEDLLPTDTRDVLERSHDALISFGLVIPTENSWATWLLERLGVRADRPSDRMDPGIKLLADHVNASIRDGYVSSMLSDLHEYLRRKKYIRPNFTLSKQNHLFLDVLKRRWEM